MATDKVSQWAEGWAAKKKKSARAQEDLIRQVTQLVKGQWECSVKRKAAMCMY